MPSEFLNDANFRFKRYLLGAHRVRRAQLYGVGMAKSGTHSICSMFSRNVRASHEPQAPQLIDKFFDWHDHRISDHDITEWIQARDREMALEVDSSWFNILILRFLTEKFPDARFVLTIRDCYSWLNSEFNRVLYAPSVFLQRVKVRKFLYRGELEHAPEEQILKGKGIYTIDGYLSRWAAHNEQVLSCVPKERLFVVLTNQISARSYEVADFAGLPRYVVRLHRTHEYKNPVKQQLIRQIDRSFLEQKVEQHCRPLMAKFFPEIESLDDAEL
jgi:Sulfotransferase domain